MTHGSKVMVRDESAKVIIPEFGESRFTYMQKANKVLLGEELSDVRYLLCIR